MFCELSVWYYVRIAFDGQIVAMSPITRRLGVFLSTVHNIPMRQRENKRAVPRWCVELVYYFSAAALMSAKGREFS